MLSPVENLISHFLIINDRPLRYILCAEETGSNLHFSYNLCVGILYSYIYKNLICFGV